MFGLSFAVVHHASTFSLVAHIELILNMFFSVAYLSHSVPYLSCFVLVFLIFVSVCAQHIVLSACVCVCVAKPMPYGSDEIITSLVVKTIRKNRI